MLCGGSKYANFSVEQNHSCTSSEKKKHPVTPIAIPTKTQTLII